jgi:rod shape-determining protein MreC
LEWFNRSRTGVILIVFILIIGIGVIYFADINIPFLAWIERGFFNLLSPVIESFSGFCHSFEKYLDGVTRVNELIRENESLRKEILELERQKNLMTMLSNENYRLRELLNFKEFVPYQVIGASVVGHSPDNREDKVLINRGSRDGIKIRMPVISYNGSLVGRIDYVGAFSSQVLLLNNPEFVVGGIVQRSDSRVIGLVRGRLNDRQINVMENISWNTAREEGDIKTGDIIVTSGLSNSFPRGLPIGEVINVEKDNYGLSQKAEIELFMSLKTVEEVLVITKY